MSRFATLLPALLLTFTACTLARAARAPEPPVPLVQSDPVVESEDAQAQEVEDAVAADEAEAAALDEMSGADDGTPDDDDELAGVPSADEGESHDTAVP